MIWAIAIAAVIVSFTALAFTILSFWSMNWRVGKLQVSGPRTYGAARTDETLLFRFPLVFFNDGPTPIVVQNLRVVFVGEPERHPLTFMATLEKLSFDPDQKRSMATPFPVRGREAFLLIYEFQGDEGGPEFEVKTYPIELRAKLNNNKDWRTIHEFPLNVGEKQVLSINGAGLRLHDNEADQPG